VESKYLQNTEIYNAVVLEGILKAKSSILIGTANVKDLQVEKGQRYISIVKLFKELCGKGVEVRILHSGIPSGAFLKDFKSYRLSNEKYFVMKRCLRVHFKCVLIDGNKLFIGSPNLTGAGLGAKGKNRRNFEIGIITQDNEMIQKVSTLFAKIWEGKMCEICGRKKYCYVPLEGPD